MRPIALLLAVCLGPAAASAADLVLSPNFALTGTGPITETTSLAVGDTLTLVLPAQASTGYSWEPRTPEPALLAPRETECPAREADGLVGAVAPVCFAWAALAAGEATITLVYRRHWETEPDGVLRYDLKVNVTP